MELQDGGLIANKRAVRITVTIPRSDRKLVRWIEWGSKHCEPAMFDHLNRTGGGKCESWYVYFGRVRPKQFSDVECLTRPKIILAQLPNSEKKHVVFGSGIVKAYEATSRNVEADVELIFVSSQDEVAAWEAALHPPAVNPYVKRKMSLKSFPAVRA